MPTLNSPILAADAEAPLGHSFAYLGNAVLQELAEQADLLSGPLFSFVGDVAGSGSDTVRLRRYGGIGAALGMTAMGSETAAPFYSKRTRSTVRDGVRQLENRFLHILTLSVMLIGLVMVPFHD